MHKGDSKGCCKDEHKVVRFIKDQKVSDNSFVKIFPAAPALPFTSVSEQITLSYYLACSDLYDLPPPHLRSIPVFIRNCNFRI
jgi:hypothetical protein